MTTLIKAEADQMIASSDMAVSVMRACEEAARVGRQVSKENRANPVRPMSEAIESAQAALPSNMLSVVRRPSGRA